MPIVFVIALDWTLRATVRAELLERRIQALGMEEADDPGRAIAAGNMPAAVVLEAVNPIVASTAIQELVRRVPTVLIASRTKTIPCRPSPLSSIVPCSSAKSSLASANCSYGVMPLRFRMLAGLY